MAAQKKPAQKKPAQKKPAQAKGASPKVQVKNDDPQGFDDRVASGKALRKQVPRSSHGDWAPAADRPDPIDLLQAEDKGRLQYLLPIKYGRMMASPFAFLRGSAVVMAADLQPTPVTGLNVVLCGDAHLSNFGIFATPERDVAFDVNDFDEAYPGPWEWDLKRLAASAVVAGRGNGFGDKTCRKLAAVAVRSYRTSMKKFAAMSIMEVWYYHVDASQVVDLFDKYAGKGAKKAKKTVKKARSRTSTHALDKITHRVDGKRQFINSPPLLVRLSDLATDEEKKAAGEQGSVEKLWEEYKSSVPEERRRLLARFHITDAALRVGGVGSVGTRCGIVLLEGDRPEDAMILQQKEADHSSLEPYLTKHNYASQAERVVIGQRLMQASSDIFLGRHHSPRGTQYYWRQFKDMKGSFDITQYDPKGTATYLAVCGHCLARAHARSGDPAAISAYLGKGDTFDKAVSKFAMAYADQTEQDHQALLDAIKSGRVVAEPGV
jgi:uncharacterized protein (DUF2252 family)